MNGHESNATKPGLIRVEKVRKARLRTFPASSPGFDFYSRPLTLAEVDSLVPWDKADPGADALPFCEWGYTWRFRWINQLGDLVALSADFQSKGACSAWASQLAGALGLPLEFGGDEVEDGQGHS